MGTIALYDKYQLASFQDVFCHPFYWFALNSISSKPQLIVDCGAHCGHFSILADLCIRARFGTSDTRYVLVEPNPKLIKSLQLNLGLAHMAGRCTIVVG